MKIDFVGGMNAVFGDNAKTRFKRICTMLIIIGGIMFLTLNWSCSFQWRGLSCGSKPVDAHINVNKEIK
jgi:hypothetical protein